MLAEISHNNEWIQEKRRIFNNADPLLVEKVIKALTLLDSLCEQDFDFIFKGGTSLLLLLPKPLRFSIDIDIIVENKPGDIEKTLQAIIDQTIFTRFEEDKRQPSNIPKAHYKFFYDSALKGQGVQYILLDILYGEHPYPKLVTKPVASPLIEVEDAPNQVRLPDINGILGDKLTAFAPHTIGISVEVGKELEIIKQLFDIDKLFDAEDDLEVVREAFNSVAQLEIGFRGKKLSSEDVLADSFHASRVIALRGKLDPPLFEQLQAGINQIGSYVVERFKIDEAITSSAKVAYLTQLLQTDSDIIERFDRSIDLNEWIIADSEYNKLNKIKKTSPEGFFYWIKAIELL